MKPVVVLLIIAAFSLSACNTIPHAPSRDEELCRQAAQWNYTQSVKLNEALNNSRPPKELLEISQPLEWGSEAVRDWVGKPEKEFKGDVRNLVVKMDDSDTQYRKDIASWKQEVNQFAGKQATSGGWLSGGVIGWVVGIGIGVFWLLKKIPFI